MGTGYLLTAADRELLIQEITARIHSRQNNGGSPEQPPYWNQSPEVYVAKIPTGGIPARTGTTPGQADCEIFKIDTTGTPTLTAVELPSTDPFERSVYNVYDAEIPASQGYALINRDKYGKWVASRVGGAADTVKRFKLTANLSTGGGPVAAVIREFNGTTYVDGSAIRIYDHYSIAGGGRGMWQAVTNMEGFCFKRETESSVGDPEYDIIWMEQYARYIEGTLDENMNYVSAGITLGTVSRSWDGVAPPTPVQVYDTDGKFPRALAGAKFTAVRDEQTDTAAPTTPRYRLIECQQMSKHAYAILSEPMTTTGDFDISDFLITDFSPFNQTPAVAPTTANNLHGLQGETNDQVTLEWDEPLGKWVIQQVDYHAPSGGSDNYYLKGIGVITNALSAMDLSASAGDPTPNSGTATTGTKPMPSSVNNAVFMPEVDGSSNLVWSRNLTNNKTFYNPTPFTYAVGDRVWVEEFPVQTGSGTARDVDHSAGKRWLVRKAFRNRPIAVLVATAWNSDGKLSWGISSQYGGLVSLADSNKNVVLDCPVFQYPFLVEIQGNLFAELDTTSTYTDFASTLGGTWTYSNNTFRFINAFRANFGTDPFNTGSPSSNVTGAASAGTPHTHDLSNHTHPIAASSMDLSIRPWNRDLTFTSNPSVFVPVDITCRALATKTNVLNLTVDSAATGTVIDNRWVAVSGAGSLSMVITPLFDA
jgi:hypothetical protein